MDKEGEKGGNDDGETFGGEADLEKNHKAKDGLKNHRQRRSCEVNRSSSEKVKVKCLILQRAFMHAVPKVFDVFRSKESRKESDKANPHGSPEVKTGIPNLAARKILEGNSY